MTFDAKFEQGSDAPAEAVAEPAKRRRVHPLTWAASAVLVPLVCWDAWQAKHDVAVRRQASVEYAKVLQEPLVPIGRPRFRPR